MWIVPGMVIRHLRTIVVRRRVMHHEFVLQSHDFDVAVAVAVLLLDFHHHHHCLDCCSLKCPRIPCKMILRFGEEYGERERERVSE